MIEIWVDKLKDPDGLLAVFAGEVFYFQKLRQQPFEETTQLLGFFGRFNIAAAVRAA